MANHEKRIIACDFDKTISTYGDDGKKPYDPFETGQPIPAMVKAVKDAIAKGDEVFIFTARVNPGEDTYEESLNATKSYIAIAQWCQKYIGVLLPVTHEKSRRFTDFWDDRAREVLPNLGVFATELLNAHSNQQSAIAKRNNESEES